MSDLFGHALDARPRHVRVRNDLGFNVVLLAKKILYCVNFTKSRKMQTCNVQNVDPTTPSALKLYTKQARTTPPQQASPLGLVLLEDVSE